MLQIRCIIEMKALLLTAEHDLPVRQLPDRKMRYDMEIVDDLAGIVEPDCDVIIRGFVVAGAGCPRIIICDRAEPHLAFHRLEHPQNQKAEQRNQQRRDHNDRGIFCMGDGPDAADGKDA